VAQCGKAEVDAAVAAARAAQPGWWKLGGHARARHLYALARHVQKNARLLAVLETLDNGKPIRETRDLDVPLVARHFYYHAGWAQLMERELPGWVPVGVAGQIIPWNFPLLMLAWKIAPALAMGNTVVLKPAEFTPLTAAAFAEICRDAGLPPGVVNILTGDGRTGELIVKHPDIDKIAFTGSTEVGRIIREATAGTGKKLSLELGGKSPFVVFDDADLDRALDAAVFMIFSNNGERCTAGSRILVQHSIYASFVDKFVARAKKITVGDPLDEKTIVGPMISQAHLAKVRSYIELGPKEGATLLCGGLEAPSNLPDRVKKGNYVMPTVFADVDNRMRIAQEEIFGPVACLIPFKDEADAIRLANDIPYGLSSYVWTENIGKAHRVAAAVEAGMCFVNSQNVRDLRQPFGGTKASGTGREGGTWSYEVFLEPKNIAVSLGSHHIPHWGVA
jgi:5-carboxymethyl-2-hydroxymuconic-semialdehyde dehydrogenase